MIYFLCSDHFELCLGALEMIAQDTLYVSSLEMLIFF